MRESIKRNCGQRRTNTMTRGVAITLWGRFSRTLAGLTTLHLLYTRELVVPTSRDTPPRDRARWIFVFEGNSIKITDSGSSINDSLFFFFVFSLSLSPSISFWTKLVQCYRGAGAQPWPCRNIIRDYIALRSGEEEILFFDNERIFAKTIYTVYIAYRPSLIGNETQSDVWTCI